MKKGEVKVRRGNRAWVCWGQGDGRGKCSDEAGWKRKFDLFGLLDDSDEGETEG